MDYQVFLSFLQKNHFRSRENQRLIFSYHFLISGIKSFFSPNQFHTKNKSNKRFDHNDSKRKLWIVFS